MVLIHAVWLAVVRWLSTISVPLTLADRSHIAAASSKASTYGKH